MSAQTLRDRLAGGRSMVRKRECRLCKSKPSTVRFTAAVVEKARNDKGITVGNGKYIAQLTRSVCDECAEKLFLRLDRELEP